MEMLINPFSHGAHSDVRAIGGKTMVRCGPTVLLKYSGAGCGGLLARHVAQARVPCDSRAPANVAQARAPGDAAA